MTTDNKTLADVQPGGRVRLGDALPPLPFTHYNACGDGSEPLYTAGQMRDYARAALSAQPSPGGQGDSRSEKAETFLRQYLTYLRSSPRQGLRPRWCDVYEALEVAIEALAARQPVGDHLAQDRKMVSQPVGEPDYFLVRDEDESRWRESDEATFDSVKRQRPDDAIALYAAPPAQAVDLCRARASIQSLLNWIDDWAETPEESGIDAIEAEAEAVLALIDSQGAR